ncbi:MAG: hypothetical protein HYX50_01365 [Chloroflexi bacterium]|nr:hypothetical protein [Chloroflexota bacterium]
MPAEAPREFVCVVCRDPVSAELSAECNWCDQRFHLNPRNDIEAKDCGEVWIDEQYLALQFACQNCLADDGKAAQARPLPSSVPPRAPVAPRVARRRKYKRRA